MAYFDWDIGPKRGRWDAEHNRGAMGAPKDTAYWLTQFEDLCIRRGMTTAERHMIWEAMVHVCLQQMQEQRGAFYDALHPLLAGKEAERLTNPSVRG
jgi:hypothetical protein